MGKRGTGAPAGGKRPSLQLELNHNQTKQAENGIRESACAHSLHSFLSQQPSWRHACAGAQNGALEQLWRGGNLLRQISRQRCRVDAQPLLQSNLNWDAADGGAARECRHTSA